MTDSLIPASTYRGIVARGASLLADGYRVGFVSPTNHWLVTSPEGHVYEVYRSEAAPSGWSCSCPCLRDRGLCKHVLGVEAVEARYLHIAVVGRPHRRCPSCGGDMVPLARKIGPVYRTVWVCWGHQIGVGNCPFEGEVQQ